MISWIFRRSCSSMNVSRSTRSHASNTERWRATLDLPTPIKPVNATRLPLFVNDRIFKDLEKSGKRNVHTLGTVDLGLALFGEKPGNRKCHRDPMITKRIDPGALEPGMHNTKPVVEFLNVGVHPAKVLDYRRDTVGLLYPQLACVADLETVFKLTAEHCDYRDLVDHRRDHRASQRSFRIFFRPAARQEAAYHTDIARWFKTRLISGCVKIGFGNQYRIRGFDLRIDLDLRSEVIKKAYNVIPIRVQSDVTKRYLRSL